MHKKDMRCARGAREYSWGLKGAQYEFSWSFKGALLRIKVYDATKCIVLRL
jgi:hypothetical protein